jgi:hypothetical protein
MNIQVGPPSDHAQDHDGGCTCAVIGQDWPAADGTMDGTGARTVYVSVDRAQARDVATKLAAFAEGDAQ